MLGLGKLFLALGVCFLIYTSAVMANDPVVLDHENSENPSKLKKQPTSSTKKLEKIPPVIKGSKKSTPAADPAKDGMTDKAPQNPDTQKTQAPGDTTSPDTADGDEMEEVPEY